MNEPAPTPDTFARKLASAKVDLLDIILVLGATLVVGGAYAIHTGLAVVAVGAGMLMTAWRFAAR